MADTPPAGDLVTLLFSDIEGSTLLLQQLGDRYDAVVLEHRRLLRAAWQEHGGYEVSTEGDSFFVAFEHAAAAIAAAITAQRALQSQSWPEDLELRVRMGLHSGPARVEEGDYFGLTVHQAARVAAAAHGGQVIVTESTRACMAGAGDAFDLADLGLHRLRDLAEPVRLLQLVHPELRDGFPPPRTMTVMPNNFPVQVTAFVGRDDDVAEIRAALTEMRMVTLTGAGGVGKTRLALEVGADMLDRFPGGAWLVDLAPIEDPEVVALAAMDALGVREQPGRDPIALLADALVGKHLLVVLDNCEHVIETAAELVHRLASACPGVSVLATSREALNVPGEVAWRVRSLFVPQGGDVDDARHSEAVQLFCERACAVRPEFTLDVTNVEAVTQICRRLDGLPLAIELAAARVRSMSVHEIAAHLDDRFRLLTGGARTSLARQRTLEAAVAWSYDLLGDAERRFFERLSVFTGGCTAAAAEAVSGLDDADAPGVLDLLDRLVDRSLVNVEVEPWGTTRYHLLETLRQFGRERLIARGEAGECRDRHLEWVVSRADVIPQMGGDAPPPEFSAEEDNFRAAIRWALEAGEVEAAYRIAGAMWTGHFDERRRLFERLLPPGPEISDELAVRVVFAGGAVAFMMGEWELGVERFALTRAIALRLDSGFLAAMSAINEGSCRWGLGDAVAARELVEVGLAEGRANGEAPIVARALMARGWLDAETDLDVALATVTEALEVAAELPDPFDTGHALELQGYVECLRGDPTGPLTLAEAAETFRSIQHNCAAHLLETASAAAAMTGDFVAGGEIWGAAERIRDETLDQPRPWERAVQEHWLPRIVDALAPEDLAAAKMRGRLLGVLEALDDAAAKLRRMADAPGDARISR